MDHRIAAAAGDAGSLSVTAAAFAGYLPDIAAGLAIIWYLVRFVAWLRGRRDP
jgi:hypothetical protein